MILEVQTYLETHSLASLKEEHGIKTSVTPGELLFSLNYDQIDSKPSRFVNQCRGVVLGTLELSPLTTEKVFGKEPVGRTCLVARPFDRFFNLGDFHAASVDLEDSETIFWTKLDGTCCIVFFSPVTNSWTVATRAVPTANKKIDGWGNVTFRILFEKALYETLYSSGMILENANLNTVFDNWSKNLDREYTFMFELTTPMNRIVVKYNEYRIHLIGIRHTKSGQEVNISSNKDLRGNFGVPCCPSHKLNNLAEVLEFVNSKSPFEQEGVVVMDKSFNRVKIKNLAYLAYNKVRDSTANSPRSIMELILLEKLDDVMPVLEQHVQVKALRMQEATSIFLREFDKIYLEIDAITAGSSERRKAFAVEAQRRKVWIAPLMDRFAGKSSSLVEYIRSKVDKKTGAIPNGILDSLIEQTNQKEA